MKKTLTSAMALALAAGAAWATPASLRFNEVLRNPKGSADDQYQYIELYGCGGESLRNTLVICVVDDGATCEVDECFFIGATDWYKTNADGYFCIWWSDTAYTGTNLHTCAANGNSEVYNDWFPAYNFNGGNGGIKVNPANSGNPLVLEHGDFTGAAVRHEANFEEIQNVTSDGAGTIGGNGSLTMFIVDADAWATALGGGATPSSVAALAKKDVVFDANRDGTAESNFTTAAFLNAIIDEFAVDDGNGNHEYTSTNAREFDFTPGFNPDVLVRMNDDTGSLVYNVGSISDGTDTEEYRSAYHEWIAAEVSSNTTGDCDEGFGAVTPPGSGNTATVSNNDVPNASPNFAFTPGKANYGGSTYTTASSSGHQISADCGGMLRFDRDGDGFVTVSDLYEMLRHGDMDSAVDAMQYLN